MNGWFKLSWLIVVAFLGEWRLDARKRRRATFVNVAWSQQE